jgi:hypothetical protein
VTLELSPLPLVPPDMEGVSDGEDDVEIVETDAAEARA